LNIDLRIETIDLARHFEQCLHFREISYLASFGHLTGFTEHYGEGYRLRLADKIRSLPKGNCHVWHKNQVVGQTESKEIQGDIGYINLLSVLPNFQKTGIGRFMIEHLERQFAALGKVKLQLSVSKTNLPAQAFYLKTDWSFAGERPDKPGMLRMERAINHR
jgi:ribosomal protein S18 acetylase RimI-like enzyme